MRRSGGDLCAWPGRSTMPTRHEPPQGGANFPGIHERQKPLPPRRRFDLSAFRINSDCIFEPPAIPFDCSLVPVSRVRELRHLLEAIGLSRRGR
jgi:hypothetical protein